MEPSQRLRLGVDSEAWTTDTGPSRWTRRTTAMHPHNPLVPYGLITFGAIYIGKPDIYYTLMSRPDASGQRRVMPEKNKAFMRTLGSIFVVAGIVILMRST